MEYSQTWKRKTTPAGRSFWAHTASAHRTSASDCSGWPTPNTLTGGAETKDSKDKRGSGGVDLQTTAMLAMGGWPTPRAEDSQSSGERVSRGVVDTLTAVARSAGTPSIPPRAGTGAPTARVAGWASPQASDHKGSSQPGQRRGQLSEHALLAGWQTVTAADADKMTENRKQNNLTKQIRGVDGCSSPAATGKRGVLNPALARWLMGFPVEWDSSGVTAMQSSPKPPRRSSRK
jgi:hypothetical protein